MNKETYVNRVFSNNEVCFADIEEFWIAINNPRKYTCCVKALIDKDFSKIKNSSLENKQYHEDEAKATYSSICEANINFLLLEKDFKALPLYVVDEFPYDYKSKPWKAMCVDHALGLHTNIEQGIYFKREYLYAGLFEIMVTHECIHHIISHYSKNHRLFTGLLEEGLCDVISYYITLARNIQLSNAIVPYLLHNRFGVSKLTYARKQYYNSSKEVLNYALQHGFESLINALKMGRGKLILDNSFYSKNPLKEDRILLRLNQIFDDVDKYLVLPAEEFAIFEYTAKKETSNLRSIGNDLGIPAKKLLKLVNKMQRDGYLFIHNDEIYNNNLSFLDKILYSL